MTISLLSCPGVTKKARQLTLISAATADPSIHPVVAKEARTARQINLLSSCVLLVWRLWRLPL